MTGGIYRCTALKPDTQIVRHATVAGALTAPTPHDRRTTSTGGSMTNIDHAADIIERATRGAHTTEGHPMKMSDHTAQIIAEALADDGALVNYQWEYAAIELCPNGPFHDDPDGYHWSGHQWWHPTEQDALDDLKTEFMQWRYGASLAARIIRRLKPHAPEVARHLYPNPHHEGSA